MHKNQLTTQVLAFVVIDVSYQSFHSSVEVGMKKVDNKNDKRNRQ
jgi:hypothetical protein